MLTILRLRLKLSLVCRIALHDCFEGLWLLLLAIIKFEFVPQNSAIMQ